MKEMDKINLNQEHYKYNYGIDALRMLAMFMVVLLHILGQGGILDAAEAMSIQYEAAWFLEIAAYCAVNCYALISGYVGIYAKYKYQNIIILWLRVVFYTLFITLLFFVFVPDAVMAKDWIKAILPVTGGYYWYFSSYFALFFFIPILNIAINEMNQNQCRVVVLLLILIFSCWQTLFSKEIFGTSSNTWWLMIVYIIGAYIRKYGLFRKCSSCKMFLGYLITIMLTWLSKFIIEFNFFPFLRFINGNYFVNNTSITILIAAIFLLLMFERIHITQTTARIIKFFSPAAFSVYLIHAHPFVWNYLLADRFICQAFFPVLLEVLSILFTATAIYASCSLIDLIRASIFKCLKIQQMIGKFEEKYVGNLWIRFFPPPEL